MSIRKSSHNKKAFRSDEPDELRLVVPDDQDGVQHLGYKKGPPKPAGAETPSQKWEPPKVANKPKLKPR